MIILEDGWKCYSVFILKDNYAMLHTKFQIPEVNGSEEEGP